MSIGSAPTRFLTCLILGLASFLTISHPCLAYEVTPSGALVPSTCNGGTLSICGVQVPMPPTTSIGNTVEVSVPSSLLANNKSLSFTVQCVSNGYGGAAYQAVNMQSVSCNAFPCQAGSVRLCDANIEVPGGTPLGGTVAMKMPGTTQEFTVQCVGKNANAPLYQITDHSAVTCPGAGR